MDKQGRRVVPGWGTIRERSRGIVSAALKKCGKDLCIVVIPSFRADGYLPEGVHVGSPAEAVFRFGGGSRRRRQLVARLRRWLDLAGQVAARRLLLDGSFVTAKTDPGDVDAVLLLPPDFAGQVERGEDAAVELENMFLRRQPEELFAAEDEADWLAWVDFFSQTREADGRRKGLVEIVL